MRLIAADAEERLQVFGQFVPAVHIGKEGTCPSTGDVVGQEVVGYIRPADGVVFSDARPGDAVELAGLHRDFDVFPRQSYWDDAKLAQETSGGWEGEDALTFEVVEAADRVFSGEVAGIPSASADMLDADGAVLLIPDFIQAVLVKEHGYVEGVARGKGEIAAKDCDVSRRRHRVVVGLHCVDGAALHGAEELAGGHQLIGVKQLDLHAVASNLVEHLNRWVDHVRGEGGASVGLHPPLNGAAGYSWCR